MINLFRPEACLLLTLYGIELLGMGDTVSSVNFGNLDDYEMH
jgi:hypothetical protein